MESSRWVSHPYQPEDCPAILNLIRSRPDLAAQDFPSLADMQELLLVPDTARLTCVWKTAQGASAGYAFLNAGDDYAFLVFEYAPSFAETDLGSLMIAWGEQTYRESYHGRAAELAISTRDSNTERIRLLERHGFSRSGESVVHMERDLHQSIPVPYLPEGFSIRCLTGPDEAEDWVALHRAAFGTQNMTVAYRQAMFQVPWYNPSLDLVAVAPDGSLAAYVVCAVNAEENTAGGVKTGTTDPVATHPAYQRLGLSRALLLTGLRLLQAQEVDTARLGTAGDNLPMQKAAESVGYRITGQALTFTKIVPRL